MATEASGSPVGGSEPSDQEIDTIDGEVADGRPAHPGSRIEWAASFSGPLPPPDALAAYDQVHSGLALEIVNQWKAETDHRHRTIDGLRAIDQESMRAFYQGERHGQRVALVAFLAVIALAIVVAVVLRSEAVAIAAIVTGGASAVWSLRRRSTDPSGSVNLSDGDALEKPSDA